MDVESIIRTQIPDTLVEIFIGGRFRKTAKLYLLKYWAQFDCTDFRRCTIKLRHMTVVTWYARNEVES